MASIRETRLDGLLFLESRNHAKSQLLLLEYHSHDAFMLSLSSRHPDLLENSAHDIFLLARDIFKRHQKN